MNLDGIIGTVIGSVSTLIVTHVLKNTGWLYFYFKDWRMLFLSASEFGDIVEVPCVKEASTCEYSAVLQVYNSSEVARVLRDITIEFICKEGTFECVPHDSRTRGSTDPLTYINLPPKQLVEIQLQGVVDSNRLPLLELLREVHFVALDHKGRKVRRRIFQVP